jgi:membrane protease YdiL (CAAX protease family)
VTPALFLANNLGIVLMIPSAWLGLIIYGQRPRWLSSVVGGIRWGWLFRILGLILLPYIALEAVTIAFTGVPHLSWKPYSLFMIFVVLFTTPLQCAGEEYGLRGLVNRVFGSYGSSRWSFWIGGVVSSVAFMLLHNAQDIYLNAFYFSFGLISCWMAWRTGGLEAGIAMHVINNVTAMAVFPFSDFSGVFNRSAGSANPWDVLPLAAVLLASVGLVEWQVRRRKPVAVAAPGANAEDRQFAPPALPQLGFSA